MIGALARRDKQARGIAQTMAIGKTRRGVIAFLMAALLGAAVATANAGQPPLEGRFGERFKLKDVPEPAPEATFRTRDGETVRLADFQGKVLLVNFWATWCAPCIEEMPTLDALAADMNSKHFQVMAISTDRGGKEKVETFLKNKLDLTRLDIYLDSKSNLAKAFGLRGMPTTYLIDADGNVIGSLEGAAHWNSTPVKKLIRHYVEQARDA